MEKRVLEKIKRLMPIRLLDLYSSLSYSKRESKFKGQDIEAVFSEIYENNHWGSGESRSGPGSELQETGDLVLALNELLDAYRISSILDLPCGDFTWMQKVNLKSRRYVGGDIVQALVEVNNTAFSNDDLFFVKLDITQDLLPGADMLLCRDCLVHFSYQDIERTLRNLKRSSIQYLLATTFPRHTRNHDIVTGDWRPLNLQKKPFSFPDPITAIQEKVQKGFEREHKGRMLGLWKIADLTV